MRKASGLFYCRFLTRVVERMRTIGGQTAGERREPRAVINATACVSVWERAPAATASERSESSRRAGVGPREQEERSLPGLHRQARCGKDAACFIWALGPER